ncbi:MAG: HAMP domain-containing protein [Alphaproteobacteria bacterium]|nr:HAMP domain-containing protein [Alphaproteobacteria bacterium]MBT5860239.1 HAMP domain-containing protein [Alphaproteobacteria bacterium]
MVLLLSSTTYVFYERHWDTVTRRLSLSVAGEVGMVIDNLQSLADAGNLQPFLDSIQDHLLISIAFQDGATLPAAPPPSTVQNRILDRTLTKALSERLAQPFQIDTANLGEAMAILVQMDDGVLTVTTLRERVTSTTTFIFIMWMGVVSLVLLAISILFLRNQVKPIRNLAIAAEAFGKGRDAEDFKAWGATEVRQAAHAFQDMRARIQRHMTQRTEMLAGVSHDLRTPLTRMRLQLEMLPQDKEVGDLLADVVEMEAMVEGYLAFARNQDTEVAVETDLPQLLEQVVLNARRSGADIDLVADENILIPLHPNAFTRCITNLVDNARRYATHVVISANRVGAMIEITVDDDGPGIPADKRDEVFHPFRRLEESRNPESGGSGLGLAIARDVIRSHGGEITLLDAPAGGLRALLRLPV